MSLSEVIAKLEHDESVKFTRELMAIRFVLKKGDERADHAEITMNIDPQAIEFGQFDFLDRELDRALRVIRGQN